MGIFAELLWSLLRTAAQLAQALLPPLPGCQTPISIATMLVRPRLPGQRPRQFTWRIGPQLLHQVTATAMHGAVIARTAVNTARTATITGMEAVITGAVQPLRVEHAAMMDLAMLNFTLTCGLKTERTHGPHAIATTLPCAPAE